jgi:hypothetical protein
MQKIVIITNITIFTLSKHIICLVQLEKKSEILWWRGTVNVCASNNDFLAMIRCLETYLGC